jgi:acetoin utilization deacetylase AcuC-like enzyme
MLNLMATVYSFVPSPKHAYPDHPEHPSRFDLLAPRLASFGAQELVAKPATREEVARVHDRRLIANLEKVCEQGVGIIDSAPTFVTRTSFNDALLACGGALDCTRAVLNGEAQNAFALVRPPGHHAEPDRAMGFCLFNNIAVAARDALEHGLERVAIVDFDAHHGNGTQAAILEDERVAYLSTHQWGIYPGTGWFEEAPHARRRIVNVPLPADSGDQTFARMADEIFAPFIQSFKPEMILVSAGFDAHWKDPITQLGLSMAGFYMLSKKLFDLANNHCKGKIVFVLEGGYDPVNVANGVAAAFSVLTGRDFTDPGDSSPYPEPDASERIEQILKWHKF